MKYVIFEKTFKMGASDMVLKWRLDLQNIYNPKLDTDFMFVFIDIECSVKSM